MRFRFPALVAVLDCLGLRHSIFRHVPEEHAQSSDQHDQERNPADESLEQRSFPRRPPFGGKDSKVGAAVRANFCSFVDFLIALSAGVHRMAGRLLLTALPTISVIPFQLSDR